MLHLLHNFHRFHWISAGMEEFSVVQDVNPLRFSVKIWSSFLKTHQSVLNTNEFHLKMERRWQETRRRRTLPSAKKIEPPSRKQTPATSLNHSFAFSKARCGTKRPRVWQSLHFLMTHHVASEGVHFLQRQQTSTGSFSRRQTKLATIRLRRNRIRVWRRQRQQGRCWTLSSKRKSACAKHTLTHTFSPCRNSNGHDEAPHRTMNNPRTSKTYQELKTEQTPPSLKQLFHFPFIHLKNKSNMQTVILVNTVLNIGTKQFF